MKPRLLILSAVYPFPRNAGQQQRVYYTLRALREHFHLTFFTTAEENQMDAVRQSLSELCDDALVLPSQYTKNIFTRVLHKIIGTFYVWLTGEKFSNYLIGAVEFPPTRVESALDGKDFDAVLFEYWHAHRTTSFFRQRKVATILDMHDILWRSYRRQLDAKIYLPTALKDWMTRRYQRREEAAWKDFDMLIAINQDELDYARQRVGNDARFFYAPMGTDISLWGYGWQPAAPSRIAYYGSLGSQHNQQDALLCYREIMPRVWEKFPAAEFWVVGSNPPAFIKELERDPRVHVTGFVERPQEILRTMTLALCPWSGTYGFRSRVVEVMSLGVPMIASEDAVHGMGFEIGKGIFTCVSSENMAKETLRLLEDESALKEQSRLARLQMEEKFSYAATYEKFALELKSRLAQQR